MKSFAKLGFLSAVTSALLGMAASSWAQTSPTNKDDDWHFTASAGAGTVPKYLGSNQQHGVLGLGLSASKGNFYVGTLPGAGIPGSAAPVAGLGYNFYSGGNCRATAGVTPSMGRRQSDADRLNGMGDTKVGINAFANASCNTEWLRLNGTVQTDVSGKKHGTSLEVEALARVLSHASGLNVYAGPGLAWGDSKFNQTQFGVSSAQSSSSSLPAYSAQKGVIAPYLVLGMEMPIDKHWSINAGIKAGSLRGSAAESPLTQSKTQKAGVVMATYAF